MRTPGAQIVVLKSQSPAKESELLGETADPRCGEEMYMVSLELLVTLDNQEVIKTTSVMSK